MNRDILLSENSLRNGYDKMLLKKRDMQLIAVTEKSYEKSGLSLHEAVRCAITGGASTVMLYDCGLDAQENMREAALIKIMCGMYDVPFLIYGDIELAEAMDADGIVVQYQDFNSKEIRRKFGMDRSAGIMTGSVTDAINAAQMGASFVFFGPVAAKSRGRKKNQVIEELMEVCSQVSIPVVAYGGITDIDLNGLRGTGICGFGVGSGIFASEDINEAAGRLRKQAIDVL